LLAQQQRMHPQQQQQSVRVHSHQSSMQQTKMSEGGCTSVSASTHTAVSRTQPQQLSSAAAAAAGPPGPASPAVAGNGSFSGAAVDVAAVAAAAAAAGVRGSFTTSAVHTASGVEEVLLPVGLEFATAGSCPAEGVVWVRIGVGLMQDCTAAWWLSGPECCVGCVVCAWAGWHGQCMRSNVEGQDALRAFSYHFADLRCLG
jgi:hypothetical protein